MERVPEPELMDDPEHVIAYHRADFSEPHNAFVNHFVKRFPGFTNGEVLDLGCGTCDVVIRLARALPGIRITGIDGSHAMLDIARAEIERHGLSERITVKRVTLPYEGPVSERFDAIISNSLLHHLRDPHVLWKTIRIFAKDGAPVFIVDLMRPEDRLQAEELVRLYAADESPILQRDFYNSLMASYTVEEIEAQLMDEGMGYMNIDTISDRHVAIWGRFRQ
jgi:ubiquinone/menaquinone biosynthesis C-methylase UbiE